MLVLSRAMGQTISIGDAIELVVLDVSIGRSRIAGATVRLGVTAPRNVLVLRGKEFAKDLHTFEKPVSPLEPNRELTQLKDGEEERRLVFSCKKDQTVTLDETIAVMVAKVHLEGSEINNATVRLGVRHAV